MDMNYKCRTASEILQLAKVIRNKYEPLPSDAVLASYPKTGTTWLKALTISILHQNNNPLHTEEQHDPLVRGSPHELIPYLEFDLFCSGNAIWDIEKLVPPRVVSTHIPYSVLPDQITNTNNDDNSRKAGPRIVYIARNPEDTFISNWIFNNKIILLNTIGIGVTHDNGAPNATIPLVNAFDMFCRGIGPHGSYFDHVLEYWKASRNNDSILFLTYEGLKLEPRKHVKTLAEFMGCTLSNDQIQRVIRYCDLTRLKKLDVNRDDRVFTWNGGLVSRGSFFRRGIIGDSKNYPTPDMEQKLQILP